MNISFKKNINLLSMNTNELIKKLPISLVYIVTNYEPKTVFILEEEEIDWYGVIKNNFRVEYAKKIMEVVCGCYHTIIRLTDGTLMSCGNNEYGQLGQGDTKNRTKFEEIKNMPKNIMEIVCGTYHTIVRLTDGTIISCGYNYYG